MRDFYRNILTLASGSAIAQVAPLLAYPILTRLYAPQDFGTFATVTLISSVSAIVASGSYEHAILITKNKREAADLVTFTIARSIIVLSIALLILALTSASVATWLNDPSLKEGLLYSPLIALGAVVFVCHSEWLVKYRGFSYLSKNRILQGVLLALSKIATGVSERFNQGLIQGELFGRLLMGFLSARTIFKMDHRAFRCVTLSGMRACRSRFSQFPKYMVPDQVFNVFVGSVHVLFIGAAFGPAELGYVSLLFSSLYLPITVVSTAIKDVFRQRASVLYKQEGTCRPLYVRLLTIIGIIGTIPFIVGFFVAPYAFQIVFGADWARVGLYAQIMLPMYYINFVIMSLGGVLVFAEKMRESLYWQIFGLVTSVVALYFGCFILKDIVFCLILLALVRALSYIIYGFLSFYFSVNHSHNEYS